MPLPYDRNQLCGFQKHILSAVMNSPVASKRYFSNALDGLSKPEPYDNGQMARALPHSHSPDNAANSFIRKFEGTEIARLERMQIAQFESPVTVRVSSGF